MTISCYFTGYKSAWGMFALGAGGGNVVAKDCSRKMEVNNF